MFYEIILAYTLTIDSIALMSTITLFLMLLQICFYKLCFILQHISKLILQKESILWVFFIVTIFFLYYSFQPCFSFINKLVVANDMYFARFFSQQNFLICIFNEFTEIYLCCLTGNMSIWNLDICCIFFNDFITVVNITRMVYYD